ncbi:hypothetical protein LKV13_03145 [Borrelia sp. BU AG58]|uniref:hypothetical protein n=1 Tax=Borrelia sp. BU AG58 TaxID=2887345 RepID=UPI001E34845A|nr:hypothetical protein [Borrelia sp. BU AG58]UER67772.1 hypothetical protein LKV13_03145 [Borrelia sp. BU AG58]
MLQAQFFVKKCKRAISGDEVLINDVKAVESVFYDFFKVFNKKSLESVFSYYYENFDFDEGIYAFIDKFLPIISFLSLDSEDVGYEFNPCEKKLILEVFDSSAGTLEASKLKALASAIVSFGILN